MPSKLEQLREITDVVADTGDIEAIRRHRPQDATTNPALVLKAVQQTSYETALRALVQQHSKEAPEQLQDRTAVSLGTEILSIVPGYVSTEVDARLSYDAPAMVARAEQLIGLYEAAGADSKRVLIKLAATWEGIRAAEILEKRGIKCNLTLLFSFSQARACADAGVFLVSPFVGRILDWHQAKEGRSLSVSEDPGVKSVQTIYHYYKTRGYQTIVMGASFRNQAEIEALAGCDKLTISPDLLAALDADTGTLERSLSTSNIEPISKEPALSEAAYRWGHNEDPMAVEKLAEGIRKFAIDQESLAKRLEAFRD